MPASGLSEKCCKPRLLLNTQRKVLDTTHIIRKSLCRHTACTAVFQEAFPCCSLARKASICLPQSGLKLCSLGADADLPKHRVEEPRDTPAQSCRLEGILHSWLFQVANTNENNRKHPKHHHSAGHSHEPPLASTACSWCPITREQQTPTCLFTLLPDGLSSHTKHGRRI